MRFTWIIHSALLAGTLASAKPVGTNCPIALFEPLRHVQAGGQSLLGGGRTCANVTLPEVNAYDCKTTVDNTSKLKVTDALNDVAAGMFFQGLANNSHRQALCRTEFFNAYATDATKRDELNRATKTQFDSIKNDLHDLLTIKHRYEANRASFNDPRYMDRSMFNDAAVGKARADEQLKEVDAQIAKLLLGVPMGYDPDVSRALIAMNEAGEFDVSRFQASIDQAKTKYFETAQYYQDKLIPVAGANGQPKATYCLGLDYKNLAGSSGEMGRWLDGLPATNAVEKSFQSKLRCQLESTYGAGQSRLTTTAAVASFAVMLIPGVGEAEVAATAGARLMMGAAGVVRVGAAVDLMMSMNTLREECFRDTTVMSGDAGQCDAAKEFKKTINEPKTSSCAMGALALASLPLGLRSAVQELRAARGPKKIAPLARAEANVDTGADIVITGNRAGGARPRLNPNSERQAVSDIDAYRNEERAADDVFDVQPDKVPPVTAAEKRGAVLMDQMEDVIRQPLTDATRARFHQLDDEIIAITEKSLKEKGIRYRVVDRMSEIRAQNSTKISRFESTNQDLRAKMRKLDDEMSYVAPPDRKLLERRKQIFAQQLTENLAAIAKLKNGGASAKVFVGKEIVLEANQNLPKYLQTLMTRDGLEVRIRPQTRAEGSLASFNGKGEKPVYTFEIEQAIRGDFRPTTTSLHEIRHFVNDRKMRQGIDAPYYIELHANKGETLPGARENSYDKFMSFDELSTHNRDVTRATSKGMRDTQSRGYSAGRVYVETGGASAAYHRAEGLKALAETAKRALTSARETLTTNPRAVDFSYSSLPGQPSIAKIPYFKDGREIGSINVSLVKLKAANSSDRYKILEEYLERSQGVTEFHLANANRVLVKPPANVTAPWVPVGP